MALFGSTPWKRFPFLQLLIPLCAGILCNWYLQGPLSLWMILLPLSLSAIIIFSGFPLLARFRYSPAAGIFSFIFFFATGAALCWFKDIRHQSGWIGRNHNESVSYLLTLEEPPVEKPNSYKALARTDGMTDGQLRLPATGTVILYFKKDSSVKQLDYGTTLVIRQPLQEIKSAGNPGGFDFKAYALFQGVTHQVYLQPGDYEILPAKNGNWLKRNLLESGQHLVDIMRRYIPGKKEAGLAEALLIGYKQDLDPEIVQSYSNTGVVHIIAISGLHLGLIYWLLLLLLKPLLKKKRMAWLHAGLVIAGLWVFSLLAGAQPSVLRSALMFSCIVLGSTSGRKTSAINSLAVSAFILLCYNPFWLWDAGFQLSYAAVLSILLFMQPVYQWFYIKNKILDYAWKMNAVTIAAQVFTLPVSLYHFHQFPLSFMLSNFIAVPLSSAILLGEIFLCLAVIYPPAAILSGKLIAAGIRLMNGYVERVEQIPFSMWEGIQLSSTQAIWMMLILATGSYWLMEKSKKAFYTALLFLLFFTTERFVSFFGAAQQQKIIVYQVPRQKAIDFINGRKCLFAGDSQLITNEKARNFHIKPTRVLFRITESEKLIGLAGYDKYFRFGGKNILCIDSGTSYKQSIPGNRPVIDLLILSHNPKLYINRLAAALDIRQVVMDGSVPAWKAGYWKKDCDSLKIPWYSTGEKGAFVMTLN